MMLEAKNGGGSLVDFLSVAVTKLFARIQRRAMSSNYAMCRSITGIF